MEGFLFQASVYLGAALAVVPLAVRLGLGSVLGYLAAGILIGPVLGLVGSEVADVQHFAEFGVVLMLFLIGLELEPRALWDMRHKLLGLGGAQIGLTTAALTGALVMAGFVWQTSLVLGLMLSLSSTAIVLQTLTEKDLMRTAGGRSGFAVLLTQDVAVVPMLALVPILALSPPRATAAHAEGTPEAILTFVQGLPGWAGTLVTLGVVVAIVATGHFLTRPVFRFINSARLHELSTFFALLIVLGIAFLMTLVGLSPALGTFVAGVVLANSEFRHELEADIKPFKGLLLGLFFMTVGAGIDFAVLFDQPMRIIGLTLGLMALKLAILLGLALVFKLRGRDRWLFALSLAQAGEFGFLLTSFAVQQGALAEPVAQVALLVIGLSMLFTPLLFMANDALSRRMADARADREPDPVDEKGRVIIAGIGRFGQVVNRLVRMAGVPTVVLDSDMATIDLMRRFGIKGFYGDPSRPELLAAAGLAEAQVLVVAVDDREAALRIVRHARSARPDLHIVARARDRVNVYELYQAGANDIVRENFDSSVRAGRYVLENIGFTEYEAARASQAYYRVDRAALRDLAELWVPGQPVHLNEAYVARARQLDADMETAMMEEAEKAGEGAPDRAP
ncbi:MAG: cation:proton antiporter [Gemmobacter sp.]|nr:cation:proton antiporter [Gemmobacter sp.]